MLLFNGTGDVVRPTEKKYCENAFRGRTEWEIEQVGKRVGETTPLAIKPF